MDFSFKDSQKQQQVAYYFHSFQIQKIILYLLLVFLNLQEICNVYVNLILPFPLSQKKNQKINPVFLDLSHYTFSNSAKVSVYISSYHKVFYFSTSLFSFYYVDHKTFLLTCLYSIYLKNNSLFCFFLIYLYSILDM